ncbi:FecR family protein [Salinibacter ruber]|uniref:FecR family protein n=1 Tax=Salinibacter ruber TaxID=146919 RepID=UPI001F0811D2|nr:FecR family protein [Salinibacter ruber]
MPSLSSHSDDPADGGDEKQDNERIWRLLQRTDEERAEAYNVDEEWDQLADRLDLDAADAEEGPSDTSPPSRRADDRPGRAPGSAAGRRQRWTQVLTVAALVLCLVGGGVLWWSQPASVTAAAGERTSVTLPDGSTVELNGGTTIEYARGFSTLPLVEASAREVRLEGEAFFSVVDGDRPFRVETPNAQVEVLGTEFHVHARPQDDTPETRVAVASGEVRVAGTSLETGAVVLDERGEASRVSGRNAPPSAPTLTDLKYVQAWRTGGFGLAEASLPAILRELEHRFGVSLRLKVPAAETDTMTLHYARDARLEDVLRDVCIVQGLTYHETSQGYELVRD